MVWDSDGAMLSYRERVAQQEAEKESRLHMSVFENLVGQEYSFYGAEGNFFKLGDTVFEALEDESDGYRSMLDCVAVAQGDHIFFYQPLATVVVESASNYDDDEVSEFGGYLLRDAETGHVWMHIGTEYSCDYYPCFTCKYNLPVV